MPVPVPAARALVPLALLALLAPSPWATRPARAQEAAPSAASAPASAAESGAGSATPSAPGSPGASAASAPALAPIPLPEISARADALRAELRESVQGLAEGQVEQRVTAELPSLAEEVEPRLAEAEAVLAASPSLARLDELSRTWRNTARRLTTRERLLAERASALEDRIAELDRLDAEWAATERAVRASGAPPALLDDVVATRTALARAHRAFSESRNGVLVLQTQVAALLDLVAEALDHIDSAHDRVVANILVRDQPALWTATAEAARAPAASAEGEGVWAGLRAWGAERSDALATYRARYPERMALHGLLFVALVALVARARRAVARRPGDGPADETAAAGPADETAAHDSAEDAIATARRAFAHPVAAALVLALLATPWLHPDAPPELTDLAWIALVVPLVLVLRPLLGAPLHPLLTALAGFYLVDQVRDILAGFPLVARWLFALETAAAAAVLLWLLRSGRLRALSRSAGAAGWQRAVDVWARVALVLLALAFVGTLLGYVRAALVVGDAALGSAYLALGLTAGVRIAEAVASAAFRGRTLHRSALVRRHAETLERRSRALLRLAGLATWAVGVLGLLAVREPALAALRAALDARIGVGSFSVVTGDVLAFFLTLWAAWLLAAFVRTLLEEEIYPRVTLPRGVPFALSTIGRYAIVLVGFLVAIGMLGFDLDRITILLGAFGVGIGFGLQNVVNNFVSGLILLFERPLQVGDRVQLADLSGIISRIGIRSSTIRTWEGADVIVPNAMLISDRVVNWTLADRLRRIDVKLGVAYGTPPRRVIEVLRDAVAAHPGVLAAPPPDVYFMAFGESSLDFEVRAWTDSPEEWFRIRSELHLAANDALRDAGIEIPFPQRDLHLRSVDPKARA